MRVARLSDAGVETYGMVKDGMVATREDILYKTGVPVPLGIKDFLFGDWPKEVCCRDVTYDRPLDSFTVLAPIPAPPKIICLAFNYYDHATEQNREPPPDPVIVLKPRTTLAGTGSEIRCPDFVDQLDYEIELAVVIGRDCRDVPVERAPDVVSGYMILNDVSARDMQFRDGQFGRAKGMDTFAPCGPWVTTAGDVADPQNLRMRTWVNGEIRQDSTTANMRLSINETISRLSHGMTLERGDIISTGTSAGVALGSKKFDFLRDGDHIRMEIEGLGYITSTVRFEKLGISSM